MMHDGTAMNNRPGRAIGRRSASFTRGPGLRSAGLGALAGAQRRGRGHGEPAARIAGNRHPIAESSSIDRSPGLDGRAFATAAPWAGRMTRCFLLASILLAAGCQITPVPPAIEKWRERAQREVPLLEPELKEGDILFRLSNTLLAGGLVDFSRTIADATESDLSHAAIVYRVAPDGVIVVDVTPAGISRRYLADWYRDGTTNVVVRRLRPEYQYLVPQVLAEADKLIAESVLYDDRFVPDNDRFYCTEMVDHCFRVIGHPLAPRIRIRDFPNNGLVMYIGCAVGRINMDNEAVVAGNEQIGLFSSPMLETVVDLRPGRSEPAACRDSALASHHSPPAPAP